MHYGEKLWTEIPNLTDKVVVVPLASLEQHGHHLPMLTDSMICAEIVRRAQAALENEALFLPLLWLGASDHHRRFPGTVSLSSDTYIRVLVDLMESLIGGGFKRIFLFNAHGGNMVPGQAALYQAQLNHRDERDLWLIFGTWFRLAADRIAALQELEQGFVTHACELETSMILCLRPDLVKMDLARGADIPFDSDFYHPTASSLSRVTVPRPFEHVSQTGAFGHPEQATSAKGEALYEAAAEEVIACIREIAAWQPFEPH